MCLRTPSKHENDYLTTRLTTIFEGASMFEEEPTSSDLKVLPCNLIRELEHARSLADELSRACDLNLLPNLDLALTFDLDHPRTLTSELSRTLSDARVHARALVSSHDRNDAFTLVPILLRALDRAYDCIYRLAYDLNRAYALAHDITRQGLARPAFKSEHALIIQSKDLTRAYKRISDQERTRTLDLELTSALERARELDQLLAFVRLDAAAPGQVYCRRIFVVIAAVRQLNFPSLQAEDLAQCKCNKPQTVWQEGVICTHLLIRIAAPDCKIKDRDCHSFYLAKGQNSPVFCFYLIPQKIGNITVTLTLYQETDILGDTCVRATAVSKVVGEVSLEISSKSFRIDYGHSIIPETRVSLGLRADLYGRLRKAFLASPQFASDATLRALFTDARIAPWRDLIPDNTPNRDARVAAITDTLHNRTAIDGQNALALFLYVMAEFTDPGDALHDTFLTLATDLSCADTSGGHPTV